MRACDSKVKYTTNIMVEKENKICHDRNVAYQTLSSNQFNFCCRTISYVQKRTLKENEKVKRGKKADC